MQAVQMRQQAATAAMEAVAARGYECRRAGRKRGAH